MSAAKTPAKVGKAKFVKLSDIVQSDTFRCRKQEDPKTVKKYSRVFKDYIKANKKDKDAVYPFPPIHIWLDEDKQYLLVSGFHRFEAAKDAGIVKILAQIVTGTQEEVLMIAMRSNRYGRKMSADDLRFAIEKALKLCQGITPGVIAKELGCHRSYAYKIEKQLSTSRQLDKPDKRRGADGKERSSKREGSGKSGITLSTATLGAWGDMNKQDKHRIVNNTLNGFVKQLPQQADKLQFAQMVIEWAKHKIELREGQEHEATDTELTE